MITCLRPPCKTFNSFVSSNFLGSPTSFRTIPFRESRDFINCRSRRIGGGLSIRRRKVAVFGFLPVDPWAPLVDSESIASQLFAASLFPYLGFLYFITKSKSSPKLTLFGFYFLLAFVAATTKVHYGTSLSNVDWLHGAAESLLTLTNLFIVIGLRQALRKSKNENVNERTAEVIAGAKEEKSSV